MDITKIPNYDHDLAYKQGWGIFSRSDGHYQIQRLDERDDGLPELPDDDIAMMLARAMGVEFEPQTGLILHTLRLSDAALHTWVINALNRGAAGDTDGLEASLERLRAHYRTTDLASHLYEKGT